MSSNDDDDIPAEIDFSGGERGKFYRPSAHLKIPVYLDAEVQQYLSAVAERRGVDLSQLTNELLRKDIGALEAMR